MKKLITAAAVLLFAVGIAVSQDYTVSNELGSEGIMIQLPEGTPNYHTDFGFGGLYDTVSGIVHYGAFLVPPACGYSQDDGHETYKRVETAYVYVVLRPSLAR